MHLPSDNKVCEEGSWVEELQRMYSCCKCARIYLAAQLFICEVCTHLMCDTCARFHGKWVHLRDSCPHFAGIENPGSHTLSFVCGSICEHELYETGIGENDFEV